MNEKFFDLKKEKQDRMINAALKVFSENGYNHASTDEIVSEASVSKGLLFHYFESKMGLYTFLYDYCTRVIVLELSSSVSKERSDFFSLQNEILMTEMNLCRQYPYMLLFLESAKNETDPAILEVISSNQKQISNCYHNLEGRADCSAIGKSADVQRLINIFRYTKLELMRDQFRQNDLDMDHLYESVAAHLGLLQRLMTI